MYGLSKYCGLDMRNLSHEQGLAKLEHLVKHFWSQTTQLSLYFQIALHWAQYNAGVSFPILQEPQLKLGHLESIWFKDLRDFLATHSMSLTITNPGIIKTQRENDCHLMDVIIQSNIF